jgi:hypothetical protein
MADDNTQSWMDFAQRSRDDGGLGLQPHQAAGVVGNLQNESGTGIPSWGPTGDNGTAWGSAQWRGDRLQALKDHADDNELDYRTPEAQQSFMRKEFDGSENKAYRAIQASTTPEDAATAMNTAYERSADRSGRREAAARSLFQDGPTAIQTAMGGSRSTGSKAMAFNGDDEETPALSPAATLGQGALAQGGAGATTAAPPQNWLDQLGTTLMQMAPGIAQDPENKKALVAAATAAQKTATDQGTWSHITLPNGQVARINSKQGIPQVMNPQTGAWELATGKYAKPEADPGLVERQKAEAKAATDRFNTLQDAAPIADDQLRNVAELRRAVQNPNVTFGGLGDASASAKNIASSLGLDVSGLTDAQVVQRLATKMQLSQGKLLPGAISNYEDKLLSQANGVGLDKSREANLAALDAQEAIYKHQKAYAQEAVKYKQEHGMLDDGWFAHSSKWMQDNAPKASSASAASTTKPFKTQSGVSWSIN